MAAAPSPAAASTTAVPPAYSLASFFFLLVLLVVGGCMAVLARRGWSSAGGALPQRRRGKRLWAFLLCSLAFHGSSGMPRGRREMARHIPILEVSPLTVKTSNLHQQRLVALQEWLDDQQLETPIDVLAAAPPFFDSVLRRFGAYLYDSGRPVYTYVYTLTAIQKKFPYVRHALPSSWDLVALWEQLEPVKHRRPVPQSVFKAMVALAVAWGWRRYAAVLVIIFLGVLRPMEGAL